MMRLYTYRKAHAIEQHSMSLPTLAYGKTAKEQQETLQDIASARPSKLVSRAYHYLGSQATPRIQHTIVGGECSRNH